MHSLPDGQGSAARASHAALLRVGVLAAVALLIAMAAPAALFAAALSAFLGLAGLAMGIAALVAREALRPDRLTRWDVAAMLVALSLLVGFFVDPASVEAFLLEQGLAAP